MDILIERQKSINWMSSTADIQLIDKSYINVTIIINGKKCNSLVEASNMIVGASPIPGENISGIFESGSGCFEFRQFWEMDKGREKKRRLFSFITKLDLFFDPIERINRVLRERINLIKKWADLDIEEKTFEVKCNEKKFKITLIRGTIKDVPFGFIQQYNGPYCIDILLEGERISPFKISKILTDGYQVGISSPLSNGIFDEDNSVPLFLSYEDDPLYVEFDKELDYFRDDNFDELIDQIKNRIYKLLDIIYEYKKESTSLIIY